MAPPKRNLLFLHVPKTGGATLTGSIGNRFDERESLLYYQRPQPDLGDLDSYRYVSGHFPLGFVERFDEPPFIFTIIREPIERALSAYSFYRSRPAGFERRIVSLGHGIDPQALAADAIRLARESSLEEFIDRAPELATFYFGSRQARVLGGTSPEGGDERLDSALAGLVRCDFVGLSERLDESVDLLTRRLGWRPLTPLPRINVTTDRLRREQVSAAGLEALAELTAVDRELHRHAVERFERQAAEWQGRRARDRSTAVEDAEPVCELHFDEAIAGAGWVGRDRVGDAPPVCWIGDTNSAWVELARDRNARALRVEVAHALEQSILESLRISLDGRLLPHTLTEADGIVIAMAPLEPSRLLRRRTVRVGLEVDRAVQPREVSAGSQDDRLLSIAVQGIALQGA